ncbi:AAA family ATPase [Armatimonas rosea]|uniref:SpoVK/Ycf46/Vps4 family AAA+-type ATPase n=1 Tax=Armatimonas rosea TaxID=685828 RepID=A0A7W9WA31_ARMRO|nr:AAA family ATPase [Armatimonas rosea]MBB6053865.1 SpoVK/Ycf46/Vps4 family AAA+-type ATPase [Armatimonas rosea]
MPPLAETLLPHEGIQRDGQRLVGLDPIVEELLLQMACQWDGALQDWSEQTQQPVPEDLEDSLTNGVALVLLHGDPGTGKSASARFVSDYYCRIKGITGSILTLTTQARGNGLVGDFAGNIWRAFDQLRALPEGSLKVMIVDEVEGMAVRRSEQQAHHEEKAATDSFLQVADELAGESRMIIFLTTNQPDEIDPALRRRCIAEFGFGRPGPDARRVLLARQLPAFSEAQLDALVTVSEGMTPVDIRAALRGCYMAAVSKMEPLAFEVVQEVLSQRHRTQAV